MKGKVKSGPYGNMFSAKMVAEIRLTLYVTQQGKTMTNFNDILITYQYSDYLTIYH